MPTETENSNIKVQTISKSDRPVDILYRDVIVDRIMTLINTIADSHGSCTFSLNGKWGVGKSFVLNLLEEKLLTWQGGEKYIVFHYNCWKYDYYEEPLFAIVSAMLEGIDEETHFFSQEARGKIDIGISLAKDHFKGIAATISKAKLGVDITELFDMLANYQNIAEQVKKKSEEKYSFDQYFSFNHILRETKDELQKLAESHTIVVVVDELDRCLPTYSIKVLERLHHLFYDVKNCVVIMAVAKDQLEHTIGQVFGDIDVDQYLNKFVDYQMDLQIGAIAGSFSYKYQEYFSMFDKELFDPEFDMNEFCMTLFYGVEQRIQEHLMGRIKTIHKMLNLDNKMDYSVMCFEMMWASLDEKQELCNMPMTDRNGRFEFIQSITNKGLGKFSHYIETKWAEMETAQLIQETDSGSQIIYEFRDPVGIPQLLIWYSSKIFLYEKDKYKLSDDVAGQDKLQKNVELLKQFDKILRVIK